MNRLLLIAFFFCSTFVFGQGGASTPADAWNNGNPNKYWFELYKDSDGSSWVNKNSNSMHVFLNSDEEAPYEFTFVNKSSNVQNSEDIVAGTDYIGEPHETWAYEEWFVVKIPSTGILNIDFSFDYAENSTGDDPPSDIFDTTIQLYEIEDNTDFGTIDFTTTTGLGIGYSFDTDPTVPTKNYSLPGDIAGSIFSAGTKFLLIRIGNNDLEEGADSLFIHPYSIKAFTNNNNCANALDFPDTTTPYSDTTDNTLKNLLNSSDEISQSEYDNNLSASIGGSEDVNLYSDANASNRGPGLWFEITTTETDLYFSACGSTYDPQILVFDACPVNGESGTNKIIGAENDNLFDGSDLNPNSGTDICLDDPFNTEIPVVSVPTGYVATDVTLYAYLFGNDDKGAFDFYILKGPSGILPVEWLEFTGFPDRTKNQLEWSTASEERNDYFIVEKSQDGENYSELGRMEGAGNSAFENFYSMIDRTPFYLTYYRVSQVDFNGTTSRGPQIVVKNESIFFQCSILNQPISNGLLQISIIAAEEMDVELSILSLGGQELIKVKYSLVENENNINVSINSLTNGVYILTINTTNRQITKKIIVQSLN